MKRPHSPQPAAGRSWPLVTVSIVSWNRADELARTLEILHRLSYPRLEIRVVDNGSADGSAELVRHRYPGVRLTALGHNRGIEAHNLNLARARGRYILMLDNDSAPREGALQGMVEAFERDPGLGAVAFRVRLPGGGEQSVGTHCVFQGCGVGFRTALLRRVGGYPRGFVFGAEEYDISFRILAAGYRVAWFRRLEVVHRLSGRNRSFDRQLAFLLRNNLWLWIRYLPPAAGLRECVNLVERYFCIAAKEGAWAGFRRGLAMGPAALLRGLWGGPKLSPAVREQVLAHERVTRGLAELARCLGPVRLGLVSSSRDLRHYIRAARRAGLEPTAVYDDLMASSRRRLAGVVVRPLEALLGAPAQVLVIASPSPGTIINTRRRLAELGLELPVLDFFTWYDQEGWGESQP